MPWWWPFKAEKRKVAKTRMSHSQLAAEFFWMHKKQQCQVLFYLDVPFQQQNILHAKMKPFRDVKLEMGSEAPARSLTAELFMDKLKALELMGKEAAVIGVLQNLFEDLAQAKAHLPGVRNWSAELIEEAT